MNFKNPAQVASAHSARLVREAATPVYSTSTPTLAEVRENLIRMADGYAGPEYCHVCGRATEHFGEHSDEQLLAFTRTRKFAFLTGS